MGSKISMSKLCQPIYIPETIRRLSFVDAIPELPERFVTSADDDVLLIESDIWSDYDHGKIASIANISKNQVYDLHKEFLILSDKGFISKERFINLFLSRVCEDESILHGDNLTNAKIFAENLFGAFDANADGRIDFCEFVCAYITIQDNFDEQMKSRILNTLLVLKASTQRLDVEREANWLLNILQRNVQNSDKSRRKEKQLLQIANL